MCSDWASAGLLRAWTKRQVDALNPTQPTPCNPVPCTLTLFTQGCSPMRCRGSSSRHEHQRSTGWRWRRGRRTPPRGDVGPPRRTRSCRPARCCRKSTRTLTQPLDLAPIPTLKPTPTPDPNPDPNPSPNPKQVLWEEYSKSQYATAASPSVMLRASRRASAASGEAERRWAVLHAGSEPCRRQDSSASGELAFWKLLSALDHASGCPKLRPASANLPLGPHWPAISGLIST